MLQVITVAEAKTLIADRFKNHTAAVETVKTEHAAGRIAAEDAAASEDIPPYSRSVMDGFAVNAADTFGAGESIPAMLENVGEILMGEKADLTLNPGECARISTGGMLPPGADAVVKIEDTDVESDLCLVYKAVSPLENVNGRGDDVKAGQTLVKKGKKLGFAETAVLAAAGVTGIRVYKKPVVGIISTGDELTGIEEPSAPGKIRDVNTYMLSSFAEEHGCEPKRYGIVRDNETDLLKALRLAAEECDLVLLSGGSSAGERDMTARLIASEGTLLAHGLAMKPGKPTVIGEIAGKAVFGLPGHPAACFFVAEALVSVYIGMLTGLSSERKTVRRVLAENCSSNHGREEYLCVKTDGETAYPLYAKSGVISLLSRADGYIVISRDREGLNRGEEVSVHLF